MEYVFILGRSFKLCLAELEAVLKREKINYQQLYSSGEILHLRTESKLNSDYLVNILGGTVKISLVFDSLKKSLDESILTEKIIPGIDKEKKNFGLSFQGKSISYPQLFSLAKKVKKELKSQKLNFDYVLPSANLAISSVVVTKRKLSEIIIIEENDRYVLAKTLCVQDFANWNKRDYQRPNVDPKKGMLPPKVARMMVNLGTENLEPRTKDIKLLDPFCGMGTILAEAMMVGYNVIGSDIDKEAVNKTKSNLEWLINKFKVLSSKFKVFVSDATHISEKLSEESIDAIVTEPYLGPLIETKSATGGSAFGGNSGLRTKDNKKITKEYLKNIITGLEKLYMGCFRDWWKILTPGGLIVIILPSFNISVNPLNIRENQRFSVEKPIDNCEKLGYNLVAGPYQYSRPKAVVIRNIYVLQKLILK